MFIKSIRILAMILVLFCYLNYYFTSVLIKNCIEWVVKKQYSEASYQPWLLSSSTHQLSAVNGPFRLCLFYIYLWSFNPLITSRPLKKQLLSWILWVRNHTRTALLSCNSWETISLCGLQMRRLVLLLSLNLSHKNRRKHVYTHTYLNLTLTLLTWCRIS